MASERPGHARDLAREIAPQCAMVVAAGGDGTVHEVAGGLLESQADCRLGILPVGSANDFAWSLLQQLARSSSHGGVLGRVDVARVEAGELEDIARCLVAENVAGTDWSAILDVLERRARRAGWTVARMARAYCAVHRAASPTKRQQRIRALPAPDSISRLLDAYNRALVAARRGGPGTCRADHWGDRGHDTVRALRLGWLRVDCGATANAFWRKP